MNALEWNIFLKFCIISEVNVTDPGMHIPDFSTKVPGSFLSDLGICDKIKWLIHLLENGIINHKFSEKS